MVTKRALILRQFKFLRHNEESRLGNLNAPDILKAEKIEGNSE